MRSDTILLWVGIFVVLALVLTALGAPAVGLLFALWAGYYFRGYEEAKALEDLINEPRD